MPKPDVPEGRAPATAAGNASPRPPAPLRDLPPQITTWLEREPDLPSWTGKGCISCEVNPGIDTIIKWTPDVPPVVYPLCPTCAVVAFEVMDSE